MKNHGIHLAGIALALFLSAIPPGVQAGEKLDLLNVKSLSLKQIRNDMNHDIYSYSFITNAGHGLQIRAISPDEKQVIMTESYDLSRQDHIHWPYESSFVKLQSENGKYLIRLLKESLHALPENDKRKGHLAFLIDRMEEQTYSPKHDKIIPWLGEEY